MSEQMHAALRRNFLVNVVDGAFFGFALGAASFVTVIPLFVSQLTGSAIVIALIPAIHTLGWQLPQLLTAQHVARLKRYLPFVLHISLHERVPYVGLALVALFLPRLRPEVALGIIFALLIWQAFGGGFAATAWQSLIAKIIPLHRLGLFYGSQSAVASLGGALAAALAGWLLVILPPPINFSATFAIASVAMGLSWVSIAATREAPHQVISSSSESIATYLRRLPSVLRGDQNFLWYLLCRWVVQVGLMGSAFYTVYAVGTHGVNEATVGLFTSIMLLAQMTLSPVVGWLGDRWGHRTVMALGTAVLAGSALVAWGAPSGGWFALVFLLLGAANAAQWAPAIAIVIDFAPPGERQTYIGLANTVIAPAAILAPLFGGWLADLAGYNAAFLASAAGASVAAFLLFLVVRDPHRSIQDQTPLEEFRLEAAE
jgi:MFS family permease